MPKQTTFQSLPLEWLRPGRYQPRQHFPEFYLEELAASIQQQGLLEPILVRPTLQKNRYEIVAGECRWRAAQLAQLEKIDCLIRAYNDREAAAVAAVENLQRRALNPLEEAQAYARLIREFGCTHDEVAATIGKSRSKITNVLRLLKLIPVLQDLLIEGSLSESHGKMLAGLRPEQQLKLSQLCVKERWSSHKLEAVIMQQKMKTPAVSIKSPNVKRLEQQLTEKLGSPVLIHEPRKGQGEVRIRFHDYEILQGILERLLGEEAEA